MTQKTHTSYSQPNPPKQRQTKLRHLFYYFKQPTKASREPTLTGLYEILTILGLSFALNIIPFAGPSNLLIASNTAILVDVDPITIGFLVALGSASAKFIHYVVTFYLGKFVNEKRRKGLDAAGQKLKKWALVAIFVAAATPIPDEPVIVPLGLIRYNPAKLFIAFFSGKLLITIIGAHMGKFAQDIFEGTISQVVFTLISIVLTIAITVVLLKIDVDKIADKILRRKTKNPHRSNIGEKIESNS